MSSLINLQAGDFSPVCPETMEPSSQPTLGIRLVRFILFLGIALTFVYGVLPVINSSVPVLGKMTIYLEENGIDPTRYFYTDVPQVKEAELYLQEVLHDDEGDR